MVSIILAVYNGERFLRECLDSLRDQKDCELQFILVDDGSTDGSGRICEEYAGCDPRFLVFHTENRGLCKAREFGIRIAAEQGAKYIGFADSDDWADIRALKKIVDTLKRLETEGTPVDMLLANFIYDKVGVKHKILKK